MKILYTTDLHGDHTKYKDLYKLAIKNKVDAVITGFDMLPKNSSPLHDCQTYFLEEFFDKYIKKYNDAQIHFITALGNDDLRIFDPYMDNLSKKYPYFINIAQNIFELKGYEFIGMNWVRDYPFTLKDRCRLDFKGDVLERQYGSPIYSIKDGYDTTIKDWYTHINTLPTLEEELEKLPKPKNFSKTVYIIHMPPSDVSLDVCAHGARVGSKSIYKYIDKHQPLLTLHGHIHENYEVTKVWKTYIGNSVVIQPGQLRGFIYVLGDLDSMNFSREVKP